MNKRMKLLIVDDDQYIINLITTIAGKHGAEVTSYTNVADALRKLMEEEFDTVLVDLHLPGMDGLSAIPLVRELDPDINIGLMTSDTRPDVKARVLTGGADFFLQKPDDIMKLWDVLQRCARKEVADVNDSATGRV
ncbi:MAG: response regulator [Thermodesulfobacteriota bacterium]